MGLLAYLLVVESNIQTFTCDRPLSSSKHGYLCWTSTACTMQGFAMNSGPISFAAMDRTGIKIINATLEAIIVMQTLSQRFRQSFGQRPSSSNFDYNPPALSILMQTLPTELQQLIVSYFTASELARFLLAGFHCPASATLFHRILCQYEATNMTQTIKSRAFTIHITGHLSCVQVTVALEAYDEFYQTIGRIVLPGIYRRLHRAEPIFRPPLHPKVHLIAFYRPCTPHWANLDLQDTVLRIELTPKRIVKYRTKSEPPRSFDAQRKPGRTVQGFGYMRDGFKQPVAPALSLADAIADILMELDCVNADVSIAIAARARGVVTQFLKAMAVTWAGPQCINELMERKFSLGRI